MVRFLGKYALWIVMLLALSIHTHRHFSYGVDNVHWLFVSSNNRSGQF